MRRRCGCTATTRRRTTMPMTVNPQTGLPQYETDEEPSDSPDREAFAEKTIVMRNVGPDIEAQRARLEEMKATIAAAEYDPGPKNLDPGFDPQAYLRQQALQMAIGREGNLTEEKPDEVIARATAYLAFLKGPAT